MSSLPEPWLRGSLPGIEPHLMPAAHALVQASEEIEVATALSADELWARPGGAAAVGYHLSHMAGSIDRLLTYARGEQLTATQRAAIERESRPADPPDDAAALVARTRAAIEHAIDVIRSTPREALLEPREVGRKRLPSNVLGILTHIGEHTLRHGAQIVTTTRILVAARP